MISPEASRSKRRVPVCISFALVAAFAVLLGAASSCSRSAQGEDEFVRLMNLGKTYYDKGEPSKAIASFNQALKLNPTQLDVHLDLANAYLLANQATNALKHAAEALLLGPKCGAAHYLTGCA